MLQRRGRLQVSEPLRHIIISLFTMRNGDLGVVGVGRVEGAESFLPNLPGSFASVLQLNHGFANVLRGFTQGGIGFNPRIDPLQKLDQFWDISRKLTLPITRRFHLHLYTSQTLNFLCNLDDAQVGLRRSGLKRKFPPVAKKLCRNLAACTDPGGKRAPLSSCNIELNCTMRYHPR